MEFGKSFVEINEDVSGSRASVSEFLLRSLLGSREEAFLPSNDRGFDEDVNMYVVGLLEAFLSAAFHEEASRYHYPTDLDLAREIARNQDDRFAYKAYRTNADNLLLAIGLFHHVEGSGGYASPFSRDPVEFQGRGQTYYRLASSSLRRLRKRSTGAEVAMTKLADRFEDYTSILAHLRCTYFHLTTSLGEGTLFHLAQATGCKEAEVQGRQLAYDRFLDAFSGWKREGSREAYDSLVAAAEGVRERDENFRFKLPEESEIED